MTAASDDSLDKNPTKSPAKAVQTAVLGDQSQAVLLKVVWTASNVLVALLLLWVGVNQHWAANKPPTPYAIALSGEKVPIGEAKSDQDKAVIIQGFVDETLTGIYTWKSDLPANNLQEGNKPVADKGINIKSKEGKDIAIPTVSFFSTMSLEPNLGNAYRQEIAQYVDKYKIGPGNDKTSAIFIPRQTSAPISIGQDTWLVNIVGAQIIVSRAKTTVVQHAYQVTVRNARVLTIPDAMKLYKGDADMAKFVAKARSSGLEITKIAPLAGN